MSNKKKLALLGALGDLANKMLYWAHSTHDVNEVMNFLEVQKPSGVGVIVDSMCKSKSEYEIRELCYKLLVRCMGYLITDAFSHMMSDLCIIEAITANEKRQGT